MYIRCQILLFYALNLCIIYEKKFFYYEKME